MDLSIILQQLSTLAIMVLIGYIGVKTKYIDAELRDTLSKIVLRITLPLLNITVISGQELSPKMLKNAGLIVIAGIFVISFCLLVGNLVAKLFKMPPTTRTIHTCMSAFGNVIFLGYPLITALFGQEGLFYAIVYALTNDSIFWTLGVYLIATSTGGDKKAGLKKLINPNTIAFILGLLMLCFGIRLPELVHKTLNTVGSMTTPLSMILIGIILATVNLKGVYRRFGIYLIILIKMLLIPALFILLFAKTNLDRTLLGTLIMMIAMPVQTIITVVASDFGSDYPYAAECAFLTTILSLGTLPVIYWLILQIF